MNYFNESILETDISSEKHNCDMFNMDRKKLKTTYEDLLQKWKSQSMISKSMTKESKDMKESVSKLEVILIRKDLEISKLKRKVGLFNFEF